MARFGFVGATYTSLSPNADAEECINWYVENLESPSAAAALAMYGTPGLKQFTVINEGAVLGAFTQNGRSFFAGQNFWEVFNNGAAPQNYGPLSPNNGPVQIVGSQTQLLILAGGNLFVFTLATNTLAAVNMGQLGGANNVSQIAFLDGFFVALLINSQTIQLSNLMDPTTWTGQNLGAVNIFPDNIVSMLVDHRELWLWGQKASTVYYDTGAAFFPVAPIPGVYLEAGSAAAYAPCKLDNSVFWLGASNDRGQVTAYRANGYAPQRISTHGVETIWNTYPTVSDALSYAYEMCGHTFWVIYFPTANATWVYDASNALWHRRGFWQNGVQQAHLGRCHTFNFGRHLVGDRRSGAIYDMSLSYLTDNGNPIVRLRRAPAVATEQQWIRHYWLQVYLETGLSTVPKQDGAFVYHTQLTVPDSSRNGDFWNIFLTDADLIDTQLSATPTPGVVVIQDITLPQTAWQLMVDVQGRLVTASYPFSAQFANRIWLQAPGGKVGGITISNGIVKWDVLQTKAQAQEAKVSLRWSDDGGHTWSDYQDRGVGFQGEFDKRVIWRRLGKSRARIYELTASDPVPYRVVDAYLRAEPGFESQERLGKQLEKMA